VKGNISTLRGGERIEPMGGKKREKVHHKGTKAEKGRKKEKVASK